MNARYKLYEIVKVVSYSSKFGNLHGAIGIVLSRQKTTQGHWGYLVSLKGEAWCFTENEIESTGKFSSYENIYSGETIKVGVKPDGTGYLKDQTDPS